MAKNPAEKWREDLAKALRRWCQENGYHSMVELARELGVNEDLWKHIINGENISNDPLPYAKLFWRTKIPEADPRKVPPIVRFGTESSRAMTNEQWQKWEQNQDQSVSTAVSEGKPEESSLVLSNRLRAVAAELNAIATELTANVDCTGLGISDLCDLLLQQLRLVADGVPEIHDEIYAKSGRNMASLLAVLSALTLPTRDEREKALKSILEVKL